MGVHVELKLKELSLLHWKSYFDRDRLGIFFTDEDLSVSEGSKYDKADAEESSHTEYIYSTTVRKAIQRLDSIGYTLGRVQSDFENSKMECLNCWNILHNMRVNDNRYDEVMAQRIDKYVTFKKWKNAVLKYAHFEANHGSILFCSDEEIPEQLKPKTECERIVYNSLRDYHSESFYGCLYQEFDPINTIRLILESFSGDETLYIDISEMVGWTYDSIDDMYIGDPREKTIVLVEGTSDKSILEFALKHIYPHLYNLYYFMDFEYAEGKNRPGGVDAISNNMKAFIASRLKSKFIAIFDNDTVGCQAKERLCYEIGSLPDNCRVLTYPDIKLAKHYPTIAVNGKIVLDNINRRACSIELYLPDYFLRTSNGDYSPIEWENRVQCKIGKEKRIAYQGVISDKDSIKARCFKSIKEIDDGKLQFCIDEWSNMKILIDTIIDAFK